MNYLKQYIEIFNTTTKWDRREREALILKWSGHSDPEFPAFNDLLEVMDSSTNIYFGDIFHTSLTFPFLTREIEQKNLEAIRLLYDLNLDKNYMKFINNPDALFTLGLIIDPSDTQMLYEEFLFLTQLLENSIKDTDIGIYYTDHLASKLEMDQLLVSKDIYADLCAELRKNTLRTSQLISKINQAYPTYYKSLIID